MSAVSVVPPAGQGALELRSTRSIFIVMWSRNPARTLRAEEPKASINGTQVSFGWGRWYYPLPPGEYEFTVWTRHQQEKDFLSTKVEIREGEVTRLDYVSSLTSLRPSALGPPPQPTPGRRAPLYKLLIFSGTIIAMVLIGILKDVLTG